MRFISKANFKEEIFNIFNELKNFNKTVDWLSFYKIPWIISFLNQHFSNIPSDIWITIPFNTNVTKAVHANINREGVGLKLKTAICQ